jgi:cysteine desulfurase
MVAALAEAETRHMPFESERVRWREAFEGAVTAAFPEATVVAATTDRLWNTVALTLPTGENRRWVAKLDRRGFQVSTGAACATGRAGPSHVLAAMGVGPDAALRTVRVSAGWETTPADWEALAAAFVAVGSEFRAEPATAPLVRVGV